jgi:hypothetical protein
MVLSGSIVSLACSLVGISVSETSVPVACPFVHDGMNSAIREIAMMLNRYRFLTFFHLIYGLASGGLAIAAWLLGLLVGLH